LRERFDLKEELKDGGEEGREGEKDGGWKGRRILGV
jgi:hypothetical protein